MGIALENTAPTRAALASKLSHGEARIAAYMLTLRDAGRWLADVIAAARISKAYGQRVARKARIEFPDYTPRPPKGEK